MSGISNVNRSEQTSKLSPRENNKQLSPVNKKIQNTVAPVLNAKKTKPTYCQKYCKICLKIASPLLWLVDKIVSFFNWLFCSRNKPDVVRANSSILSISSQGDRLIKLHAETRRAAIKGFMVGNSACYLDPEKIKRMQENTDVDASPAHLSPPGPHASTQVCIYNSDTFVTMRALQLRGLNPVGLNMANAVEPGGGAFRGAMAQEESLFYRSNYFQSLCPNFNRFLKAKLGRGGYKVPELGVIYSPEVQVFRKLAKNNYAFAKPFSADMIASAAYCMGSDNPSDDATYVANTKEKIRAILRKAAETGHDSVVLGAFGCGAFRNDAQRMANFFKEILQEAEFKGHFKEIAFGVIDDGNGPNHQIFHDALHGMEI